MIKSKLKGVIQKKVVLPYDPANFKVPDFFKVVEDPQEIIDGLQPYDGKYITFDTETNTSGLANHDVPSSIVRRWVGKGNKAAPQDFPFCMSFCDGTTCYSIFDSLENKFAKFKKLSTVLEDESIEKVLQNSKYDLHILANIGMKIKGKIHDTITIAKLVDENRHSFSLMDIVQKYPNHIVEYEYMVDTYKKVHKVVDYRDIPIVLLGAYSNADVWNTMIMFQNEFPLIEKFELTSLYETESKCSLALWEMERQGLRVNLDYEEPLKEELQSKCNAAEQAIYDEAGKLFNINSGKQLYSVLLGMGTDPTLIKISDKGNPVLDKYALDDLATEGVSIVLKILEFRKYEKLLGTYAVGIYAQRDSEGRVHCSINSTEARTGRMSITRPGLQTLGKRDHYIRNIFIPSDGYTLYAMDLAAIEYRLFASYAKTTGLIEMIKLGHDIHQATAALIFSIPYEEVTSEQRQKAKTINFALLYSAGDAKLATSLGIPLSEARDFKRKYFAQIPEAEPFISQVQRVTKTRGYIKNMYGRRRRLNYNDSYKAPNALIQGCAADYFKSKIVEIYRYLKGNDFKSKMVLVCHDEIVFEIYNGEEHILPKLRYLFSEFNDYRVPITAGVDMCCPSYGEKKTIDVDTLRPSDAELEKMNNYNIYGGDYYGKT